MPDPDEKRREPLPGEVSAEPSIPGHTTGAMPCWTALGLLEARGAVAPDPVVDSALGAA